MYHGKEKHKKKCSSGLRDFRKDKYLFFPQRHQATFLHFQLNHPGKTLVNEVLRHMLGANGQRALVSVIGVKFLAQQLSWVYLLKLSHVARKGAQTYWARA
jgi:hypothetical protein